ncbi:MAG: alpha/beta fold hydrolase [Pseudomonadota bacterium]
MNTASDHWTTESALPALTERIESNWSRAETLDFVGVDSVAIHAVRVASVDGVAPAPPILLLPGRTEPVVKYRELAYDLNRAGHTLYLIDHRGQGASGRLLDDTERGHVLDFAHYVDDAERLLDTAVLPREATPPVLFAHSMGGCVGARLLQRRAEAFAAAVLFSPMLDILTGTVPGWIARSISAALDSLPFGLADDTAYVPGGGGFEPMAFEADGELNPLTHSPVRFERLMHDYVAFPAARLGSPTRGWFKHALAAMADAIEEAERITCPTLVFGAGDDPIVGTEGQIRLCNGSEHIEGPRIIATARHELLMERDDIRNPVLDGALAFVRRVTAG